MQEDAVQNLIRRDFAFIGPIWRNNSGALTDSKTGRLVRFGLGNDSASVNKRLKSSDLIGITPVLITPEMVGRVMGIFTALECKGDKWSWDERSRAQQAWIDVVKNAGGYGGIVDHPSKMKKVIGYE